MGRYPQLDVAEQLLVPGRAAYWQAYPELIYSKHMGFLGELCHEMRGASIPYWMSVDAGAWSPPVRFIRIPDAMIWLFDGVAMTDSGRIIEDSAFTLIERSQDLTAMPGTERRRGRTLFDRRMLRQVNVIDTPVLVAANGWNRAFGHWIYDTLTAIVSFIEPIRSGRLSILVPELTAWQREWLTLIGIPESSILEAGFGHVRARHAIVASSLSIQNVRYPGPHAADLIRVLRSLPLKASQASPCLYLSRLGRGDASHRTLEQEERIISSLAQLGFHAVAPETLTPAQQVALFAQARVIMGPVGSAFALSGLASARASIVEILPPPAAHSWIFRSSAYFDQYYGCIMAEVIQDSRRDLDEQGLSRPGWFYNYRVNHDALLRIAERAVQLSM